MFRLFKGKKIDKYVHVVMEGYSMFSTHSWKGRIIDGKVYLKKGYREDIFQDNKPIDFYDTDPMCAANVRRLIEITKKEYKAKHDMGNGKYV